MKKPPLKCRLKYKFGMLSASASHNGCGIAVFVPDRKKCKGCPKFFDIVEAMRKGFEDGVDSVKITN